MTEGNNGEYLVYVGTFTSGRSEGIYVCRLDPSSGSLHLVSKATGLHNPSFLALHPTEHYLYAATRMRGIDSPPDGTVTAFAIDRDTGELTLIDQQSSLGPSPPHLSLTKDGRYVLVADYASGSVTIMPIQPDGTLGPATDFIQHHGSSVHPERQTAPHAHSVIVDPTNRYAFVPDLGLDKIMIYKLDLDTGKLMPNDQPWVQVNPGSGPRHFTFHPSGDYAYVINELGSTVTAFSYDDTAGTLSEIQTTPTLPPNFQGANTSPDIHLSPSGSFLYGSNRGHDSIAVFAVDEDTGTLTSICHQPTLGKTPHNFAIDPTGRLLLAANMNSDTIVTFWMDGHTGRLTPTGQVTEVPTPSCLKILHRSS